MADPKTPDILEAWRTMAEAAVLPAAAPKPSRGPYSAGIGVAALALVIFVVALSARGNITGPQGPTGGGVGAVPSTTASAMAPTAPPRSTEVPSPPQLPNPGGTCSASQFVLGRATSQYENSTFFTKSVFVWQPIRNAGDSCELLLPAMIGVASASGPFQSVRVKNGGTEVSFKIRSGQSVSVVLGDLWYDPDVLAQDGRTVPPCADRISDITRAEFPVASGSIKISWDTVWQEVCSSPASVSVRVEE
jgi:hypothetical protein